ncbi:LOW QUALITY PROTEIN: uncharacterized protein FPRO_14929 [Fusarium proliferatum ET1]|uniref:Uncharacterized protein n=1 Tax=Fusarium proliferatum (strain ET1) TaxID=1227346 RepID=A0A1L7VZP9_FUSPR|nr:LOW QUALITY PROTEIN: uncharacterized protein FPRO_14929 [Fusarium proliferatum ET1]CZR45895.1 uncharacterized protein FPRO_14929 [Fusarium proliferatum ET1]
MTLSLGIVHILELLSSNYQPGLRSSFVLFVQASKSGDPFSQYDDDF